MKKFLVVIVCAFGYLSHAQELNYVENQFMVQLEKDYDVEEFRNEISTQSVSVTNVKLVSKTLGIWLCDFDTNSLSMDDDLARVKAIPNVIKAQVNHYIQHRATVPNDGLFGSQWQYYQANDKDIDADEAWDITTGGTTANGDEIVVAVIDDGLQLSHPDMLDNIWRNDAEVPNNGIDDDGNGYIDDYNGWNSFSQDDAISQGWHGTPVCGIVGAKGNNGFGVTGVNWDVKIMVIEGGSGVESEVINSYSYALDNRILYNTSGGTQGAFVVATNASWGVDFGQPDNAPLWCQIYDTLGQNGILSTGATINGNEDVDVVGDLPTACPSDYLITVTNVDQNDEKVFQAGYGTTTIDLGAHGQNTFNVTANSNYGPFGGTSGATPHVTGAIALLYSVPNTGFANLAISNPQQAATIVKNAVLNNVDPLPTLDGLTVTGGRLNLFNSVDDLNNQTLSVIDLAAEEQILSIYPNPTESFLLFKYSSSRKLITLSIFSIQGKLISSIVQDASIEEIEVSSLSPGTYILKYGFDTGEVGHEMFIKK
jgi:subtilisin family serine protease